MAITFPTTLDALTNPISTDQVSVVPHASQHADINDIAEALEAKVGVNDSTVTTSLDFMLRRMPRLVKAGGYTIVAADKGKLIAAAAATAFTLTLPSNAAVGADFWFCVVNEMTGATAANRRNSIARAGADTIDGGTAARESYPGDLVMFFGDGAGAWTTQTIKGGYLQVLTADSPFTVTWPAGGFTGAILDQWAGGAGGGSGRCRAAGAAGAGGSGGGGGSYRHNFVARADLGTTSTVTVAATAAGGPAQLADTSSGTNGTVGNNTTITVSGQTLTAFGGGAAFGGTAVANTGGGGSGVLGVGNTGGTAGVAGGQPASGVSAAGHFGGGGSGLAADGQSAGWGGGSGGAGSITVASWSGGGSSHAGCGGGAGGGVTTGNVGQNGGSGGIFSQTAGGGGANGTGGAAGTAGTAGIAGPTANGPGSSGGGGGGSSTAGNNGGAGGAGGIACGGGGGGAATNDGAGGAGSGAGGTGGAGLVRIWFLP